jgi:hypothetical protein
MTVPTITNSISRSPLRIGLLLIPLVLGCLALPPTAGAAGKGPPTSGVPNGMQEFTTVGGTTGLLCRRV